MKKHLIAVLLTACLLFSFGTTAFADPSGGQEPNANNSATQDEETYTITYVDGVGNTLWMDTYNKSEKATVREDIPTREGYIFDKWKDEENKTYEKGSKLLKKSITLTAQWDEKKGHFGYYLSDSNAYWVSMPTGVIEYQDKDNGKTKYSETKAVAHGDTTTVTSEIPELEGHVFLGWGDKERKNNGPDQAPAIRKGGDTVTYYYKNEEYYTLDALWGSLTATGGTKVYDGKPFKLNPAVLTLNDKGLNSGLPEQYYKQLETGPIEYSENESSWTENLTTISFTDVGTHTLYVRQTIKDSAGTQRMLTAKATYTITKRDVTLTSASAEKEYNGEPLTNNTVTAEGFVNGEGATYNVTGTQTEVGSSKNEFTYTLNSNTKPGNYNITTQCGTLTVTKKPTPDPVDPNPNPNTTPTPTPVVTPAPTAAPSTDDTTPENTATPAPTATAVPTATPAPAPTAAPAAARAATTIPQTGDNFPAVALVLVMLAAIVGLGITVVLRTDKKK